MHICILQHISFETPGKIIDWVEKKAHTYTVIRLYESDSYPDQDTFDWLIVMGGPMGVHDVQQYPWLHEEKKFIANAIQHNKKIIGICLGAQLLADCLGARVHPNDNKEIGWFPITLCNQNTHSLFRGINEIKPLHWHGDAFDLPQDSLHIAASTACKNQAFLFKNTILGLQFHLELSVDNATALIEHSQAELAEDGPYIQTQEKILNKSANFKLCQTQLFSLLDEFTAL